MRYTPLQMKQLRLFPVEPRLSKSKFVAGLQCHKRLYLEIHSPELATEPDEQTQAVFDNGSEVGELARRLFPGGVLVAFAHGHHEPALQRTAELLADPTVPAIFEAAFKFDNVLVRVDVLERVTDGAPARWRLIEVKASTRVKPVHLEDLAIQAYVLAGAGVFLESLRLMYINRQYLYEGGQIDLGQLFAQQDLTAQVTARSATVPPRLAAMKTMLMADAPPDIQPGSQCHEPFGCPFWEHCTAQKPPRWVFYLPGGKRTFEKLTEQGIELIDEIPEEFKLSGAQQRMKDNVEWLDSQLKTALQAVRYPVHHLDFETFMPGIPLYPCTRPYHTLPFQWSNHIATEDGALRHDYYLSVDQRDQREELLLRLLTSLGREGSICVYSGYEWKILMELAETFPRLRREISAVADRLWDLLLVIRRHYYHPDFEGSFSIKAVLPALVPALGYADLEIQDGAMASLFYERMVFGPTDSAEKARLCTALLTYCKRDTLGMVEIRRTLLQKALAAELTVGAG